MKPDELIAEVKALPIEDRAFVVDSLLRSMTPVDPDLDRLWSEVASRRLAELKDGKVEGVAYEAVIERLRGRHLP